MLHKIASVLFVACSMVSMSTVSHAGDNVVIVLDDSGSMNERMRGGVKRMAAAKSALTILLNQFSPDTKLGLVLLNGERTKNHWAIQLELLSSTQAIRRVESVVADGGTPLGDRIREGADALLKLREKQVYGNYRLLVVTDGEASDPKLLELYLPDVLSRGLIVDAIGVDMKQDHTLATRVHSYRRADDAAALSKALQEVFAEKADIGATGGDDDFELLQSLDDATAKEALVALSRPNNASIVGLAQPAHFDLPVVATSPVNSGSPAAQTALSFGAVLMTCMVPVVLFLIVAAAFLSRITRTNRRR
jgi:hypothetical protein